MSPFLDLNPDAPDEERYKAIVRTSDILALVSPDGLRWRLMQDEPILTERPFDSHNIAFWDAEREEYVAYTRGVAGRGNFKNGVRWIRRTTSKTFVSGRRLNQLTPMRLLLNISTPMPASLMSVRRGCT